MAFDVYLPTLEFKPIDKNMEKLIEEILKRKEEWEVYSQLGMGIDYKKMKEILRQSLTQYKSDIESNMRAEFGKTGCCFVGCTDEMLEEERKKNNAK